MQLPKTNQTYYSLKKGYEGELLFDKWLETLKCDCLVLNDLLLKVNNQTFQIDSLLIMNNQIYVFEIKNYEGDYIFKDDRLVQKSKPDKEISNPLLQLARTDSLLRQLLQKFNHAMQIQSFVVFINPEFTLFQAPPDKPFLFPNQINRFIEKLNNVQSKIHEKHKKLAEQLISVNINENPYQQFPSYEYQSLRKGITCGTCHSFSVIIQRHKCICTNCKYEEKVIAAVLRSVEEFKLLFPNEKITTNKISEWCKIVDFKKRIHRILDNHYTKVGVRQWLYYQ
ncbi:nuclease-related domain-containing protein [Ureibacillus sp. GCM10028918]|uniref:nuclease-related domain-containing protein n=1 Tax=Ureibacillus sp. GCM10028918 TaxID=3273429 RepID=UPI0036140B8D